MFHCRVSVAVNLNLKKRFYWFLFLFKLNFELIFGPKIHWDKYLRFQVPEKWKASSDCQGYKFFFLQQPKPLPTPCKFRRCCPSNRRHTERWCWHSSGCYPQSSSSHKLCHCGQPVAYILSTTMAFKQVSMSPMFTNMFHKRTVLQLPHSELLDDRSAIRR